MLPTCFNQYMVILPPFILPPTLILPSSPGPLSPHPQSGQSLYMTLKLILLGSMPHSEAYKIERKTPSLWNGEICVQILILPLTSCMLRIWSDTSVCICQNLVTVRLR